MEQSGATEHVGFTVVTQCMHAPTHTHTHIHIVAHLRARYELGIFKFCTRHPHIHISHIHTPTHTHTPTHGHTRAHYAFKVLVFALAPRQRPSAKFLDLIDKNTFNLQPVLQSTVKMPEQATPPKNLNTLLHTIRGSSWMLFLL